MSLKVEWIDEPDRWRELASGWDGLVESCERPSVFTTWDFLEASWLHFAAPYGDRLAIFALHEGDGVIGFAPLRLSRRRRWRLSLKSLRLLASWEADRTPFVFPRGRERECTLALLRFLGENGDRWDSLDLVEVAADGEILPAFREWRTSTLRTSLREVETSASPYVSLDGSWEDYLSRLGASTRKHVRRWLRKLEALGGYEVEVFKEPGSMNEALDAYLGIEAVSWKSQVGQGIRKSAQNVAFYRDLLPRLARRGRAEVVFLRHRGERLAGFIELSLETTVYASQTTFDSRYEQLSPGAALQALCLKRRMESGASVYELFAKFHHDKLRWADEVRPSVNLKVRRLGSARGWLCFGPSVLKGYLRSRRWLRQPLAPGRAESGT
jgi:CelD/BcsL family acetyltransferase involved in cellulose biosynthesis